MPIIDRETLKSYFNTGDVPNEQNYSDLIDTIYDIPGAGLTPHGPTHKHGGIDPIATTTPGAYSIPMAGADGKFASGWLPTISHASLANLLDDDHTQYLTIGRHDISSRHTLGIVVPHDVHSALSGLNNDDHTQYLLANGSRDVAGSLLPSITDAWDLGSSSRLWRSIYASEFDTFLLKENAVSVVGGMMFVGKNQGSLSEDVSNVQTQINFGTNMAVNDFVLFRVSGAVEYMQIISLASGTTYNVSRNKDGSGANAWPAGSVWFNLGYNGTGRIEFDAIQTPRMSIKRQGTAYNSLLNEPIRIGDLNGWDTVGTERYGVGIGDFSNGNYLRYDPSGGFVLKGGDGGISVDNNGLYIRSDDDYGVKNSLRFIRNVDQLEAGRIYGGGYYAGGSIALYIKGGLGNTSIGSVLIEGKGSSSGYLYLDTYGGATFARLLLQSVGGVRTLTTTTDSVVLGGAVTAGSLIVTGQLAAMSYIDHKEGSAPGIPASTYSRQYVDANGYPVLKNDAGTIIPMMVSRVSIPVLQGVFLGATVVTVATNSRGVAFRDSNTDIVFYNMAVPPGWGGKAVTANIWWSPSNTNVGGVVISIESRPVTHGVTLSASSFSGPTLTPTTPGIVDRITKTSITNLTMGSEGQAVALAFYRAGSSAGDTYAGTFNLLAIELQLI